MIKVDCSICGQELKEPGALVFSPPLGLRPAILEGDCTKYHVCQNCWYKMLEPLVRVQTNLYQERRAAARRSQNGNDTIHVDM